MRLVSLSGLRGRQRAAGAASDQHFWAEQHELRQDSRDRSRPLLRKQATVSSFVDSSFPDS